MTLESPTVLPAGKSSEFASHCISDDVLSGDFLFNTATHSIRGLDAPQWPAANREADCGAHNSANAYGWRGMTETPHTLD